MTRRPLLTALPGLLLLSGCVTPATSLATAEKDPWESANRKTYAFNKRVDAATLKPAARVYRTVVPQVGRRMVTNFFNNYGEAANFMNAVLQGKISTAMRTVDRFVLNSTLGIAGINDVATDMGRPENPEDFGQTFARWGIGSGPYVMLPVFGPSTLRDAIAFPFDFIIDPADFTRNALFRPSWWFRGGQIATRLTNTRAQIMDAGGDKLLADSLDDYTLVKSAWLQRRRNQLFDGNAPLDDDPFAEEPVSDPPPPPPAEPAGP